MSRWVIRWVTVVAGAAALYGASGRDVEAVVPNACPMYECTQSHCYWDANPGSVVIAYYDQNDVVSTQGRENIFAPSSAHEGKAAKDGDNMANTKVWDSCSPHCGKDNKGVWQAPQTVSPAGKDTKTAAVTRWLCPNAPGGVGKQVANPNNNNPNQKIPPGITED